MHKKRVFVGLSVALFALAVFFVFNGIMQLLLLSAFALASQAEFYALAKSGRFKVYSKTGLTLGALALIVPYLLREPSLNPADSHAGLPHYESAFLMVVAFVVMLRTMFDKKCSDPFSSSCITLVGVIYIPMALSYFMRLAQFDTTEIFNIGTGGVFLAFYPALVVKLSDTGAFAFGIPFGKHKMCPRISPKKSWEGFVGGILAGVISGVVLATLAAHFQWGPSGIFFSDAEGTNPKITPATAAVLSFLLVIAGVLGDLVESMYKRAVSVKDSSLIFPSMGGLLDVADSLIFAAPCMYYFLLWL